MKEIKHIVIYTVYNPYPGGYYLRGESENIKNGKTKKMEVFIDDFDTFEDAYLFVLNRLKDFPVKS